MPARRPGERRGDQDRRRCRRRAPSAAPRAPAGGGPRRRRRRRRTTWPRPGRRSSASPSPRSASRRGSRWPAGRRPPPASGGPGRRPGPATRRPPARSCRRGARTSAATKPGYSEARSSSDFTSVTPASLRSLVSTPEPFWPPPCTSTSATSSAGRRGVVEQAVDGLLGEVLQAAHDHAAGRGEQRRRGQLAELRPGVRPEACVSESSASSSWRRTASRTPTTVRSERNSSLPVTRVTRPSTSAAAVGPAHGGSLSHAADAPPERRSARGDGRAGVRRARPRPRCRRGRCAAPAPRSPRARRRSRARDGRSRCRRPTEITASRAPSDCRNGRSW